MIKQKTGVCLDCGNLGAITAKRCQKCYWAYRSLKRKESPANLLKIADSKKESKERGEFFRKQIQRIPKNCEECGTPLAGWRTFLPTSLIAHILPKRKTGGFPSVATEENNVMFFCPDCHTNFDNKGADFVKKMKSLFLMKERLSLFINKLSTSEKARLPDYLQP